MPPSLLHHRSRWRPFQPAAVTCHASVAEAEMAGWASTDAMLLRSPRKLIGTSTSSTQLPSRPQELRSSNSRCFRSGKGSPPGYKQDMRVVTQTSRRCQKHDGAYSASQDVLNFATGGAPPRLGTTVALLRVRTPAPTASSVLCLSFPTIGGAMESVADGTRCKLVAKEVAQNKFRHL